MPMKQLKETVRKLLHRTPELSDTDISCIEPIIEDASGRKFYRLHLDQVSLPSLILMVLNDSTGPVVHAAKQEKQSNTFVELSQYFSQQGLNVCRIVADGREDNILLVSDFGDVSLRDFAFSDLSPEGLSVQNHLGDSCTEILFKKAVDLIKQIQNCTPSECIAFRRSMNADIYLTESRRMIDHFLLPHGFSKSEIQTAEDAVAALSEEMAAHPETLIHRDFMTWNLQITPTGEIGLIDFQDACIGSPAYDLVSLLHDRDVDFALGKDFLDCIISYYTSDLHSPATFIKQYRQSLLQRYLRLAGQFDMLTRQTGRPHYKEWVPGCWKRIGQVIREEDCVSELINILYDRVEDFREGVDNPWPVL